MSDELLNRAITLMRERAEAATPGPWVTETYDMPGSTEDRPWWVVEVVRPNGNFHPFNVFKARGARHASQQCCWPPSAADATHIASWHPAVALAVADWLEAVAAIHWPKRHDVPSESHYNAEPEHNYLDGTCDKSCWRESYICNGCGTTECKPEITSQALAVARAYLGEAS